MRYHVEQMSGFLLVDKPVGLSSFAVVQRVRRETGVKRVGHAGTLDPFASGLLVIGVGKAYTRQLDTIQKRDKTYRFTLVPGIETTTLDSYGDIVRKDVPSADFTDQLARAIPQFIGQINQIPPMFSAKKVDGQRLYKLARKGQDVVREPKTVDIYELELVSANQYFLPACELVVRCSKGTYVRVLSQDLAAACGTVAYTKSLIREKIGEFQLSDALSFSDLSPDTIRKGLFK